METGTDLWNDKYSLAGNTFAIRKDSPTGEIVQEMTTDEKVMRKHQKRLPMRWNWEPIM